jgi:cytochrome c-type biogenesis protein CcmH/NrfG
MVKKASSKVGRKRPARKEFLIPVHVVGQTNKGVLSKEKEEIFDAPSGEKNYPKIIEDENNLPVFEREVPEIDLEGKDSLVSEEQAAQIIREQRRAAMESRKSPGTEEDGESGKTGGWSLAKKKTVMWASVAAVTAVIFFIWLSVVGKNLSLNLGSNSYTYLKDSVNNQGLDESFENLQDQWKELGEYLENQPAAENEEQALGKLKEKILIEEMKNKIEN